MNVFLYMHRSGQVSGYIIYNVRCYGDYINIINFNRNYIIL